MSQEAFWNTVKLLVVALAVLLVAIAYQSGCLDGVIDYFSQRVDNIMFRDAAEIEYYKGQGK